MIPAKPETAVPKLSFSTAFKERAALVSPERIRSDDEETEATE